MENNLSEIHTINIKRNNTHDTHLRQSITKKRGRIFPALIRYRAAREHKGGVAVHVTGVLVAHVEHSVRCHTIEGRIRSGRGVDRALVVAKGFARAPRPSERVDVVVPSQSRRAAESRATESSGSGGQMYEGEQPRQHLNLRGKMRKCVASAYSSYRV
jgi:hypothetical protein